MIKKENAKVAPGTLNDRAEKKRKQSSWLIAGGTLSGIPLSIAYFSLGSTLPWLAAMVGVPAAFFGAGLAAARKADALNQEASAKIKGEKPDPAKLLEQAQKISQRGGFYMTTGVGLGLTCGTATVVLSAPLWTSIAVIAVASTLIMAAIQTIPKYQKLEKQAKALTADGTAPAPASSPSASPGNNVDLTPSARNDFSSVAPDDKTAKEPADKKSPPAAKTQPKPD